MTHETLAFIVRTFTSCGHKTYTTLENGGFYNKSAELKTGGTDVQQHAVPHRTVYREGQLLVLRRCPAMALRRST